MKRIPLSGRKGHGKETFVDDQDFETIRGYTWHLQPANSKTGSGYAVTFTPRPEHKRQALHHLLLKPPPGMYVDHINGNALDNRRANLRVCTASENSSNSPKYSNNTSGYKGVSWSKRTRMWHAYITADKKRMSLGFYPTAEDAALMYDRAASLYHGEFARLNGIEEERPDIASPDTIS